MGEFDDYQLDPFEEHGTIDLADELETSRAPARWPWIVLIAVIVAMIGAWAYWTFLRAEDAAAPPVVAAPALPSGPVEVAADEEIDLPVLAESDSWLRDVVGQLSEHPRLATWLLNEDLVARLVAMVDNLAEGVSPRTHVRFLAPEGEFEAIEREGRLMVDPDSYSRYALLVGVIGSLHVDGTAKVYRNIRPLLDQAYRDLGYPEGNFDAVATKAVRDLLDTPVLREVELEQFASSFKYRDQRLEGLSEAQKHYLRMGPDNLQVVQDQVRRIALRAGLAIE